MTHINILILDGGIFYVMEEKFRLEFLTMIDKFVDKNIENIIDGCLMSLMKKYDIEEKTTEIAVLGNYNENIIDTFVASIRLEGKSENTISQYVDAINYLLDEVNKNIPNITTNDVRFHLANYQAKHHVSNVTVDNRRRYLSAFFKWCTLEEIITKNPMIRIGRIKNKYVNKKPFTDEDTERLKDKCETVEDRAILEFLLSTGCRVSEVAGVNLQDIDFQNGECTVLGKGNKERTVYISERAMYHIKNYIKSRTDNSLPLFLNERGKRMSKECIRLRLHKIGSAAHVDNVHPHRCRRTMASDLARKGVPIQYIQQILGHEKLDTTMIYCSCDKNKVRNEYNKVM